MGISQNKSGGVKKARGFTVLRNYGLILTYNEAGFLIQAQREMLFKNESERLILP